MTDSGFELVANGRVKGMTTRLALSFLAAVTAYLLHASWWPATWLLIYTFMQWVDRYLFKTAMARSVPRQHPPYRPLAEVVEGQNVFELRNTRGTMVGFRFPAYVEGIEVAGYHLHFLDEAGERGGHVLDSRSRDLWARLDPSEDLHVELPPGVELDDRGVSAETHAAIAGVEGG